MNCKKCGSPLIPNEKYCQKCGEIVDSVVSNEAQSVPVQPVNPNVQQVQVSTPVQQPVQSGPVNPSVTPTPVQQPVETSVTPNVASQPQVSTPVQQPVQSGPVNPSVTSTPVQPNVTPNVTPQPQVNVQQPVQPQVVADPNVGGVVPPVQQTPLVQPQAPKKNNKVFIIIVVILALIIVGLGVFIVMNLNGGSSTKSSTTATKTTTVASDDEEDTTDEEEVTTTTTANATTTTTTKKKTTTTTTTNAALTNNSVSFGGYNFTIPSGFKYQTDNGALYIWNSDNTAEFGFMGYQNYSIDYLAAYYTSLIGMALNNGVTITKVTNETVGTNTYVIVQYNNSYGVTQEDWLVGLGDSISLYGGFASDDYISSHLSELNSIVETATSDGTGSFAADDDLTLEPYEDPFEW